ncbi:MAG: hypothetical protein AB8B95_09030 [Pseudohongiellaceae bacterium]
MAKRIVAAAFGAIAILANMLLPAYGQTLEESSHEFTVGAEFDVSESAGEPEEGELSPEELAAEQARILEIRRQQELRQQALIEMQSDLGIYDPALQEAYSDFGAFYSEIEDFENAIKLHTDALQVARINTGLYSEEQLPIIDALIRNNGEIKDWAEVDDLQELDYFVASRLYDLDDPELIEAIEGYGGWKLRVIRENMLDLNSRSLMDQAEGLSRFYSRLFAKIDAENSVPPLALLDVIEDKTQTDLTLARSIAQTPFTVFEGTVSRFVVQNRCQNRRNAQGQVVRQCVNVQVENPRYRQSQRDAKNMMLRRYTRQIDTSIERLREIRYTSEGLSSSDKQWLDSRIAELETESVQLLRSGQRVSIF